MGLHHGVYGAVDGAVVGLAGAADGAVLEVLELHRGLILAAEAVADGRAGHLAGVGEDAAVAGGLVSEVST